MDPNTALNRIRTLLVKYRLGNDMSGTDRTDFFNHVEALVEWLDGGGFLPKDWERPD